MHVTYQAPVNLHMETGQPISDPPNQGTAKKPKQRSQGTGRNEGCFTRGSWCCCRSAFSQLHVLTYLFTLLFMYWLCVHTHARMLQHTCRCQSTADGVSHLTSPLQMFLYVRTLRLTLKIEIFNIQKEDAFQPGPVAPGSKYQLLRKHLLCTHPRAICGTALNWELPE